MNNNTINDNVIENNENKNINTNNDDENIVKKILNIILKNTTEKILIKYINKNINLILLKKYCDNKLFIKILLTLNKKNDIIIHCYNNLFIIFIKKVIYQITIKKDNEFTNLLNELNEYHELNNELKLKNKKLQIPKGEENKCKYCNK